MVSNPSGEKLVGMGLEKRPLEDEEDAIQNSG